MFEEIEGRLARLDHYRPFDAATLARLERALDPIFIYHSNALEGNTLSLRETIYFIDEGRLPGGKREEEILEVRGQQAALAYVREAIDARFELSEKLVRELHQLLTEHLPVERYAPGTYKPRDNMVRLQDGTLFPYVTFLETPAAMHRLVAWHRDEGSKLHPVEHAAQFHYRFILIHPFLDGNGRTARLLTRLVLASRGYPPVTVLRAEEHRERYVQALRAVDESVPLEELRPENPSLDLGPFVAHVEREVLWSLDLALDVVEGRVLETTDDLIERFARFETSAVARSGLASDDAERLRISRATMRDATEKIWAIFDRARQAINERSHLFRWGLLPLSVEAIGTAASRNAGLHRLLVEAGARVQYGLVRLVLEARQDSVVRAAVPKHFFAAVVTAEPHRVNVWTVRACQIDPGGRWNSDDDPSTWSSHLAIPVDLSELRESELSQFLIRETGRFLDLIEHELVVASRER